LCREGGGGDGLREDAEPGAAPLALPFERGAHRREERAPGADLAAVRDHLRAVGVVQPEERRLLYGVRGAEAGRVPGVPLDLGRPPVVALDQDAGPESPERNGAGEVERLAGRAVLGPADLGDDGLGGLAEAAAAPRERDRRPHELEEAAPIDRRARET